MEQEAHLNSRQAEADVFGAAGLPEAALAAAELDELLCALPLLAEIAAQTGLPHAADRMKQAARAIRTLRA